MSNVAALPLSLTVQPIAAPAPGTFAESVEIKAESAASATLAASFDALLAQHATAPAPASSLQQAGKTLPPPANMVAALLPQEPLRVANATGETVSDATATPDEAEMTAETDEPAIRFALPDPGLLAAIFSAPQRLASATPDVANETTRDIPPLLAAPSPQAQPAADTANSVIAATTVALARTARIEQEPMARPQDVAAPSLPSGQPDAATAMQAAPTLVPLAQTRPAITQRGSETGNHAEAVNSAPADTAPVDPAPVDPAPVTSSSRTPQPGKDVQQPTADLDATVDMATQDLAVPVMAQTAEAATGEQSVPVVRAEAKVERIDFATLVETLSRAREEASPRTLNVAVTNTDFGRVSLRFDQDDTGLSVAMSSADPGFVRAVSATAEAASANNAQTQAQADGQPKSQAGSTAAQGDASRQSHHHQQQPTERPTSPMPSRATPASRPGEDAPASDSGIYA